MHCPYCASLETIVKDSRTTDQGRVIRRRRHCPSCGGRFTTFEKVQMRQLQVIKRSGVKRPFDKRKIFSAITTAVRKRNIDHNKVEEILDRIVVEIESSTTADIPTRKIGNLIMQELAKIDQVAYIRFASVYKDFNNAADFAKFINKIKT